jgi:NADPH-dependent 2,4-dienoyl-CoA reductase/sulfur reductase-like enzyme
MDRPVVVIGSQAAGMSAASAAKRVDPDLKVVVLEKGPFISYGACSIPYYVADDIKDYHELMAVTPEAAATERGIVVQTEREVLAIDIQRKNLVVEDRRRQRKGLTPYHTLVIATGAAPIRPVLPGIDLKNIFSLRTLEDGIAVKEYVDAWSAKSQPSEGPKVVIVGGGYIGMEMCEALARRGGRVTVVEKMDRVLGSMDTVVTDIVEKTLAREGVQLHKETTVQAFDGAGGVVNKVITDKGEFAADIVILAIGVNPASALAASAGIEVGIRKAITVDEHMRTSVADIYAAGDCADAISLITGKKTYIPLGTTANKQGRVAGENVAGRATTFEGVAGTAQTKIFNLEVARTGLSSIEAAHEGFDFLVSTIQGRSRAKPYPAGTPIFVTYIVERGSARLLGAEMVGQEGVAHRIDTLATCLYGKMTVEDVARLDLGYAPPFATVWDPILIAANAALKRINEPAASSRGSRTTSGAKP